MSRLDRVLAYAAAQPHWFVYAITVDGGSPVYIGRTKHPEHRWREHCYGWTTRYKPELRTWIDAHPNALLEVLDHYETRQLMIDAEREYIAAMRPMFNQAHNPDACPRTKPSQTASAVFPRSMYRAGWQGRN